jgi:hypothetical protein
MVNEKLKGKEASSSDEIELDDTCRISSEENSEKLRKESLNAEKTPYSEEQIESVVIDIIDKEQQTQEEKKGF